MFAWAVLFHLLPLGSRLEESDSLARISPNRRTEIHVKYEAPLHYHACVLKGRKKSEAADFTD